MKRVLVSLNVEEKQQVKENYIYHLQGVAASESWSDDIRALVMVVVVGKHLFEIMFVQ